MAEKLAVIFEDSGSKSDFSGFSCDDEFGKNESGNILVDWDNKDGT